MLTAPVYACEPALGLHVQTVLDSRGEIWQWEEKGKTGNGFNRLLGMKDVTMTSVVVITLTCFCTYQISLTVHLGEYILSVFQ